MPFSSKKSNIFKIDNQKNTSPTALLYVNYDINGKILLVDLLVRKVTDQQYISTENQSISV